jgi:hypothetical protein
MARLKLPTRLIPLTGIARIAFLAVWALFLAYAIYATAVGLDFFWEATGSAARAALQLLRAAALLGCALILIVRRPKDPLAPWASLLALAMMFGDGPPMLWALNAEQSLAGTINYVTYALLIFVLAMFPDGRFRPRWTFAATVILLLLHAGLKFVTWPSANLTLVALSLACVALIYARYRRMPEGAGRQQVRWAMLAFSAHALGLVVFMWLQSTIADSPDAPTDGGLFIAFTATHVVIQIVVALGLTVALLRYRLYDADRVITRSAALAVLTLGLGAFFTGFERLLEVVGEEFLHLEIKAVAVGIAATISAALIGPVHTRLHHWAERRFQPALADLRRDMPQLMGDLRETASLPELFEAILARVEMGVRANRGAILLDRGGILQVAAMRDVEPERVEKWLARFTGEDQDKSRPRNRLFPMRIPLAAEGRSIGSLVLGPRPDGSFYNRDEREALAEISAAIAHAIAIVEARERDRALAEARAEQMEQRIAELESALTQAKRRRTPATRKS